MRRYISQIRYGGHSILLLALLLGLATSTPQVKPLPESQSERRQRTEEQWAVRSVARELVATAVYATRDPKAEVKPSDLTVRLEAGSDHDRAYLVTVRNLFAPPLSVRLSLEHGLWEPATYAPLANLLRERLGFRKQFEIATRGRNLLGGLTDGRTEVLQNENRWLSLWLSRSPLEPLAHEQAALLLASAGLKEDAGVFSDQRGWANRITAHLAWAAALRSKQPSSLEGRVAHLLEGLLVEADRPFDEEIRSLAKLDSAEPELKPWLRVAEWRYRKDWRDAPTPTTQIERRELFRAACQAAGSTAACRQLARTAFDDLPDWPRILLEFDHTYEDGWRFAKVALPFEKEEAEKLFPELAALPAQSAAYARGLNREPRGFVSRRGHDRQPRLQVIDDGMWAQSLQRHLCHILLETDRSLAAVHRNPGESAAFEAATATIYGRLRLFPLVAAMERRAEESHAATPGLDALLRTHPQWVPAAVWGREAQFRPLRGAESAEGWFSPALPAGTVYDFAARVESLPGLQRLGHGELERLAQLSPWNFAIAERLVLTQGAARPSSREFEAVLGKFLSFYHAALRQYPVIVRDNPEDYAAALSRMATLDPTLYATLGAYHARHHQDDEAAQAYLKVIGAHVAGRAQAEACGWLAEYYLGRGRRTEALAVGKLATDTGLASGWETMALVLERLDRQEEAEALYQKIEELYDDPSPLALFYARQAGIPLYAAKRQAALTRLFPKGIVQGPDQNSTHPPDRGVTIRHESGLAQAAGLRERDVVVAVNGQAAGSLQQYAYLRRAAGERNPVNLLVFHEGGYRELHVSEDVELPLSELATYHR